MSVLSAGFVNSFSKTNQKGGKMDVEQSAVDICGQPYAVERGLNFGGTFARVRRRREIKESSKHGDMEVVR